MPRSKITSTKTPTSSSSRSKSRRKSTQPSKKEDSDSNDSECSDDEDEDNDQKEKKIRDDDWQSFPNEEDGPDDQIEGQGTRHGTLGRAYLMGGGTSLNCDCLSTGQSRNPPCACCEPKTDFSYCCGQSEQRDHQVTSDQNRPRPLCYPLACPPNPHWEREIVKYNPGGKWDPKIEEKGESGHPNLKGGKNKNNKSGKNKKEDKKPVAIGEPCNAYRCYKDPNLPCGLAYCTPKHLKKSQLPPCPQKFPIKPRRLMICPPGQDAEGEGEREEARNNLGCGCCQNRHQHQPQFPQFPPFPPVFGQAAAAAPQPQKIPDEWIQLLPVCDEKVPPNLGSGSGGQKKEKRK